MLSDGAETWDAGENLENDADFGALDRAARGKPEQQVGDLLVPRVDPEWKEVEALATALLTRSQDLRIMAHLAVARLNVRGLAAFAETLATIRHVLDAHWPLVHPCLDPEDDLDPTLRANALLALASPTDVLPVLRVLPLAASPRAGRVTWRDVAVATGVIEPPAGTAKIAETVIRAAFQETDRAQLYALRDAAGAALQDAAAIPAVFDAQAGNGTGPELKELVKQLRDMHRTIIKYAPAEENMSEAATLPEDAPLPEAAPEAAASASSITAISTRADAMRLLDLVAAYYARYEPSSPLPLLLDRARRLADMSFIDILRDLAPDGLNQAKIVAGPRDD